LAGIYQHPSIQNSWIFKGGTCLKKCYFETYRFSEDLDFTLTDPVHLNPEFLRQTFLEIGTWLYDQCGLQLPPDLLSFDLHPDPAKKYVEGKIGYIGPRQNNDLITGEVQLILAIASAGDRYNQFFPQRIFWQGLGGDRSSTDRVAVANRH